MSMINKGSFNVTVVCRFNQNTEEWGTGDMPEEKEMSTDSKLRESFRNAGADYGYDDVDAEFTAFKELKIKWQRSRGRAEFKVSDYLADADPSVIEDMARSLFSRMTGGTRDYPESMKSWVTSEDFVKNKQPLYLRRSRNLTRSHKGNERDLNDSVRRLEELGLIKMEDDVFITWTREPNVRRVGYCSVIMKVIAISSIFDNDMIPEFVLDYVVYHEFLHVMSGFDPAGRKHGPEFNRKESLYPKQKEAEEWMKRLCLYL